MPSYRRTQVSKWARGSSGNHLSPRAEKSLTVIRDGTGLLPPRHQYLAILTMGSVQGDPMGGMSKHSR
jgi:hypothetical protein